MTRRTKIILCVIIAVPSIVAGSLVIYIRHAMNREYVPRYGKGHVGLISEDAWVATATKDNEIIYDYKTQGALTRSEWKGTSGSFSQTVLVTKTGIKRAYPVDTHNYADA